MSRLDGIKSFYHLLDVLSVRVGGTRRLDQCTAEGNLPARGVYFFYEHGEMRTDSGKGLRVVRVGTHGVSQGSRSSLKNRLHQHRGTRSGAGSWRGSVFRELVGKAISNKYSEMKIQSWMDRSATAAIYKEHELPLERMVSEYMGRQPFVWVAVDDVASKDSMRSYIERNAIACLSNYGRSDKVDRPSDSWLGFDTHDVRIRDSGLWNRQHVDGSCDADFLDILESYIKEI